MSEQLPPPLPGPEKDPISPTRTHRNHTRFILMIILGVLLLFGSAAICAGTSNSKFWNFIPFAIVAVGSFISVFF